MAAMFDFLNNNKYILDINKNNSSKDNYTIVVKPRSEYTNSQIIIDHAEPISNEAKHHIMKLSFLLLGNKI